MGRGFACYVPSRPRQVHATATGPDGVGLARGHLRRAEADALALAVELGVQRLGAVEVGALVEGLRELARLDDRVLVRVARDTRVAVGVGLRDVAGLAGAAVGLALAVDRGPVEVRVQVLRRAGARRALAVGELVDTGRADAVGAGLLGAGHVEQDGLSRA